MLLLHRQLNARVARRVFGGNVGAEREELGRRARQSECTCAHQERLALLPPRLVPRIDVHAGGDDGLEQDLDCCFVLLLQRQLHARVARLIFGGNFGACV